MMMNRVGVTSFLLAFAIGAAHGLASADDWPWWRGADHTGISTETGWVVDGQKDALWTKDVGRGYSSVSVVGGRLFTLGFDKAKGEDVISCLNAETGEEVWTHRYKAKIWAQFHGGGSLTTPSIDDGRVFCSNREGHLFCLDAKTGKVKWEKNLFELYDLKHPTWGFSASPLILGDQLIMNLGKVIALNKKSGKEIWKTKRDYGHAYATPVEFQLNEKPALAVFAGLGLVVLDRKGKELYTHTWKTKYDVNAATPVPIGEKLFISSGYGRGCALVELAKKGPKVEWESTSMRTQMSGCVLYENHLYGFDDSIFKCLSLDGDEQWRQRGLGKGAFVLAGDKLVIVSSRGHLVIAEASPASYQELYREQVIEPSGRRTVFWTTPVVANGLIYVRSSSGQLVCRDHRAQR